MWGVTRPGAGVVRDLRPRLEPAAEITTTRFASGRPAGDELFERGSATPVAGIEHAVRSATRGGVATPSRRMFNHESTVAAGEFPLSIETGLRLDRGRSSRRPFKAERPLRRYACRADSRRPPAPPRCAALRDHRPSTGRPRADALTLPRVRRKTIDRAPASELLQRLDATSSVLVRRLFIEFGGRAFLLARRRRSSCSRRIGVVTGPARRSRAPARVARGDASARQDDDRGNHGGRRVGRQRGGVSPVDAHTTGRIRLPSAIIC